MKALKLITQLTTLAAIITLLRENKRIRNQLTELTQKYWEGNMQIALYSDEVTKLRRKAKWEAVKNIRGEAVYHYCPICNNIETIKTNFCSRCGADMREGKQ